MKMLTTAAAVAAVLVSAGAAMAASVVPGPVATMVPRPNGNQYHRNQYQSNQNLRVARRHIEVAIDELHRDPADYGGHKEKAVDDLTQARGFLEQGLSYERTHGRPTGAPVPATGGMLPVGNEGMGNMAGERGNGMLGQGAANENIVDVRRHVEAAIDALGQDTWDYGGFKEKAMDRLQAARAELEAALDFIHNPGVRNGGSGGAVSDGNLRYVDAHIGLAIDRLSADRNDYGGHRVAAIDDLQTARNYIGAALTYDASHDRANTATGAVVPGTIPGAVGANGISQRNSNDSLLDARRHIENAIDALQRDAHDYGGDRVKAMDALQAARSQLLQAIEFRKSK